MIDGLPHNGSFPITFTLPHEHEHGVLVPLHMRCQVILDAQGTSALIDTDMDLYNSLEEFEAPDPRRIQQPSRN